MQPDPLGALPPNPRSLTPYGNQKGQGKEGRTVKSCPFVIPPPRCSGCSPAEPYPPGGQKDHNMVG